MRRLVQRAVRALVEFESCPFWGRGCVSPDFERVRIDRDVENRIVPIRENKSVCDLKFGHGSTS